MIEPDRNMKTVFEWAILQAVAGKMRSAIELIESSGDRLPTDEVVTGAGILCNDAGTLLESIYDERLAARVGVVDGEAVEEVLQGRG